jgi:hypothetical protein
VEQVLDSCKGLRRRRYILPLRNKSFIGIESLSGDFYCETTYSMYEYGLWEMKHSIVPDMETMYIS